MLARDLMLRVWTILQDEGAVRWPLAELCVWINDGLTEIASQAPVAFARMVDIPLVAGAQQTLPASLGRILRPVVNATTASSTTEPRRAITITDRDMLDAVVPDWQAERRRRQQVVHVMFDEADPRTFWTYPANDGTGAIRALVAAKPTPIAASGDPTLPASYGADLGVEEAFCNALVDWVLYRAYSKDAQFAPAAQRAAAHYGQFVSALNLKMGADTNLSPNRKPGVAGAAPGVTANA